MRKAEFDALLGHIFQQVSSVLTFKRGEYAKEVDVLANFTTAANLQHTSRPGALAGMLAKHTVSIFDMAKSPHTHSLEEWDEKIIDHINYLILLYAILVEELNPPRTDPDDTEDEDV